MSKSLTQIIEVHPLAPRKPEFGEHCNGCGVCCAAEPCPVAFLFLFQFKGRCRALLWQIDSARYLCGMVVSPDKYVGLLPKRFRERMGKYFASRIGTEVGCDFEADVVEKKFDMPVETVPGEINEN